MLEIGGSAIVRVGNGRGGVAREVVGKEQHLGLGICRAQAGKAAQVGGVHCHNVVETAEVGGAGGTGTMREAVAAPLSRAAHALIGKFAFMIVNQTGRINLKICASAAALRQRAEYLFGQRGATYIAETYK